jgi:hypothetical protein
MNSAYPTTPRTLNFPMLPTPRAPDRYVTLAVLLQSLQADFIRLSSEIIDTAMTR